MWIPASVALMESTLLPLVLDWLPVKNSAEMLDEDLPMVRCQVKTLLRLTGVPPAVMTAEQMKERLL